jgi:hypothetical protein
LLAIVTTPLELDKLIPFPALRFKVAVPIDVPLTYTVRQVFSQVVETPLIVIL